MEAPDQPQHGREGGIVLVVPGMHRTAAEHQPVEAVRLLRKGVAVMGHDRRDLGARRFYGGADQACGSERTMLDDEDLQRHRWPLLSKGVDRVWPRTGYRGVDVGAEGEVRGPCGPAGYNHIRVPLRFRPEGRATKKDA